jgi:type I restriction enzyme S subunit
MVPRPRIGDGEADKMPKRWHLVRLADLVGYEKGNRPSEVHEDGQPGMLPYLTVKSIRSSRFNQWARDEEDTTRVHRDDIIMIWDGFYSGSVFTGVSGILGSTAVKLTPKRTDVDKGFLYNFLTTRFKELNSKTAGMYLKHVSKSVFESLGVLLPPLPEQRKIAAIFSTVDDAIQKTDEIIAKTQQLKKGLMQRLLTKGIGHTKFKQTEIGKIPEEWKVLSISEMGEKDRPAVKTGPFGTQLKTEHFRATGVPVLNIASLGDGKVEASGLFYVSEDKARELAEYKVRPGDLVFSRVAEVGRSIVVPPEADGWMISSNLFRISISLDLFDPGFLMFSLTGSPLVTKQVFMLTADAGREIVNSTVLGSIRFPIPSLDEQKRIAAIIQTVQSKVETEITHRKELEKLRRGLMRVLLSGTLRVRVS